MTNPLLELEGLPPFSRIRPEHVLPALEQLLAENRAALTALLDGGPYRFDTLVRPLEAMEERLARMWSPVGHLNAVLNSEALREAYNAGRPLLAEYHAERGQNEALHAAFKALRAGEEYPRLDTAQRKIIDDALRDFRLAGAELEGEAKGRFKAIKQRLSTLSSTFSDNLMDATHAWGHRVTEEALLAGLPESARAQARHKAQAKGEEGWLFDLEFPSYFAVITHADHRPLREALYTAYVTRASDQGPNAGEWDNAPLMEETLALRHELAGLLGFRDYAEYSLATKMAHDPDEVLHFLHDLAARTLPVARRDLEELTAFARAGHGVEALAAWDIPYYSEKLREQRYAISQETLRPYFPEERVLGGLFAVVERLFGVRAVRRDDVDLWHPQVRYYELLDAAAEVRGGFYLDLYARPKKRGGAWMDDCRVRSRAMGKLQLPVAYLTCNLNPPVGDTPALFSHDEVQTLFHEFGHGLHHMLTRMEWPSVSGINGVAWDAVELPSQFLENWCWEWEALQLISGHHESGEPLPRELYERMSAAKNFQAGMQGVRQLEFALFDLRIHREYDPALGGRIEALLAQVRAEVAVVTPPPFNRFANGFSHIFAGGYAAGYYSYKWAEVLSADAFSLFEERGVFDRESGERFLHTVLEQGGSREAMALYVEFRGREPTIDALLRHTGITA